jgi:hypothetical protein
VNQFVVVYKTPSVMRMPVGLAIVCCFLLSSVAAQEYDTWSGLHNRSARLETDARMVVVGEEVFLEQRDEMSEVFLYKLNLEGEVLDSLVRGDFGPYAFYEQLHADPVDSTLWMIGYAYLLEDGNSAAPNLSVLHFDRDLELISYHTNDALADFFSPNMAMASNESSFARNGDRIYARYYGRELNTSNILPYDVVMDTACNVLNTTPADFSQPYAVMATVEDRLFGCFGSLFSELNPVNLEPIQENSYDWLGPAYNFDGFGFNNASNFFPYFKPKDGNLVFANLIYSLNDPDSIYQSVEIRTPDFELVRRSVVHGLAIEGPGLEDGELRPAYQYPLDYNANDEYFLLGFDFANGNRWRLSKVDANLERIWDVHVLLPFSNSWATGVAATPDGGCLAHGQVLRDDLFPEESRHILYKFDPEGGMTNVVILGERQEVKPSVFPNPCTDQVQLAFPKAWAGKQVEVKVFSSNGSPVHQQSVGAGKEIDIATIRWPSGIYWVQCREVATGRLLGVAPLKVSR